VRTVSVRAWCISEQRGLDDATVRAFRDTSLGSLSTPKTEANRDERRGLVRRSIWDA